MLRFEIRCALIVVFPLCFVCCVLKLAKVQNLGMPQPAPVCVLAVCVCVLVAAVRLATAFMEAKAFQETNTYTCGADLPGFTPMAMDELVRKGICHCEGEGLDMRYAFKLSCMHHNALTECSKHQLDIRANVPDDADF